MTDNYYLSRRAKLLQEFDQAVGRAREVFVARYGEQLTNELVRETRKEYEALIPQLPYIGGKQPFTQFIISTAWFLAMYRVLTRRGETVEQVGTLAYDASAAFLKAYPGFLRRFFGRMTFSRIYLQRLQKRAAESEQRRYPADYVYRFVEGDGETYDYGVDYVECATVKFLKEQGAPELAFYLCAADRLYSEALGWGLMRTMTLAEGAEKCDFRFKKGGETIVLLPLLRVVQFDVVRCAHNSERKGEKAMSTKKNSQAGTKFFDMQAKVGITKHIGGFEATKELLSLCHIEAAQDVLEVGCGIGVGPAYIAKTYPCRVVGVDISEKMIEWSRRRAREGRVADRVEFRTANVLDLPFEADRFDVVICESVLVFVEDKPRAIRECVRVTKPGGYVGLNEAVWIKQPSPEMVARVKDAIGPSIPTVETWYALWEASGLQDRVVRIHEIDARVEIKSRLQWVGWRWILRAWGRGLRLYITNPTVRQSIKEQFDVPSEVFQYAGYGLFVGKK